MLRVLISESFQQGKNDQPRSRTNSIFGIVGLPISFPRPGMVSTVTRCVFVIISQRIAVEIERQTGRQIDCWKMETDIDDRISLLYLIGRGAEVVKSSVFRISAPGVN